MTNKKLINSLTPEQLDEYLSSTGVNLRRKKDGKIVRVSISEICKKNPAYNTWLARETEYELERNKEEEEDDIYTTKAVGASQRAIEHYCPYQLNYCDGTRIAQRNWKGEVLKPCSYMVNGLCHEPHIRETARKYGLEYKWSIDGNIIEPHKELRNDNDKSRG